MTYASAQEDGSAVDPMQTLVTHLAERIATETGIPFEPNQQQGIGGGSINRAYRLSDADRAFFVKVNRADRLDMFTAEAAGLTAIAATQTIRVPSPLLTGTWDEYSYLVMEYLDMGSPANPQQRQRSAIQLGQNLAALHRVQGSQFGWPHPNTIGSTPQINTWESDWVTFYQQHRLRYQLHLARRYGGVWWQRAETLTDHLEDFFQTYHPQPSLLHGDLWSGNYGFLVDGTPVIFDPATYYGDRETDMAMTSLFGGFPSEFYAAYEAAFPLDAGYHQRQPLYQLYHLLNHLNLFGAGYLDQVIHTVERCCRSLGVKP